MYIPTLPSEQLETLNEIQKYKTFAKRFILDAFADFYTLCAEHNACEYNMRVKASNRD